METFNEDMANLEQSRRLDDFVSQEGLRLTWTLWGFVDGWNKAKGNLFTDDLLVKAVFDYGTKKICDTCFNEGYFAKVYPHLPAATCKEYFDRKMQEALENVLDHLEKTKDFSRMVDNALNGPLF